MTNREKSIAHAQGSELTELLPCPFCGSDPYKMAGDGFHCRDCHAWQNTQEEWNRRANRLLRFSDKELEAITGSLEKRSFPPQAIFKIVDELDAELTRRAAAKQERET